MFWCIIYHTIGFCSGSFWRKIKIRSSDRFVFTNHEIELTIVNYLRIEVSINVKDDVSLLVLYFFIGFI